MQLVYQIIVYQQGYFVNVLIQYYQLLILIQQVEYVQTIVIQINTSVMDQDIKIIIAQILIYHQIHMLEVVHY